MSWIATKYVWKCSHRGLDEAELVKGTVKLLFLALAYRVPKDHFATDPTSLGDLRELTGIQERQLRDCRDVLIGLGELEQARAGKYAVYELIGMKGPLFAIRPDQKAAKIAGFFCPDASGKAAKIAGFVSAPPQSEKPAIFAAEVGKDCRLAADADSYVLSTSTVRTATTAGNAAAAAVDDDEESTPVDAFLEWFLAEYPHHRAGILYTVHPVAAERVVRELLRARSVERLQAMARLMWAERRDPWVCASDYGLHVLKTRAAQFDNQVIARAHQVSRRVGIAATSVRPAADAAVRAGAVTKAIGQWQRHVSDTPFGLACAAAVDALTVEGAIGSHLAAHVMAAARAVVDLAALEDEAQTALASFKVRMAPADYHAAVALKVDELLRERLHLPDLRAFAPLEETSDSTDARGEATA